MCAHLCIALLHLDKVLAHTAARLQGSKAGAGSNRACRHVQAAAALAARVAAAAVLPCLPCTPDRRTSSIFCSINLTIGLREVALSTISLQCAASVPSHWFLPSAGSPGCCCCCVGCCSAAMLLPGDRKRDEGSQFSDAGLRWRVDKGSMGSRRYCAKLNDRAGAPPSRVLHRVPTFA